MISEHTVIKATGGNEDAVMSIIHAFQNPIYRYVNQLIRNEGEAEDIVQETFIKMYHKLPSLKHPGALKSWLFRIATNLCIDYQRSSKRNQNNLLMSEAQSTSFEDEYEWCDLLEKALLSVPDKLRIPLLLKELEGFSYDDISKILELRIGTVRSRIFRARETLRSILLPVKNQLLS